MAIEAIATEHPRSVKLFYSYSHNDRDLRNELAKHLGRSLIAGWHDREITPGTNWANEIDTHLNSADIILLLISADFMDSDYCSGIEMERALERQSAGEAFVIPIILRPVYLADTPIEALQMLPTGGKPVTTWINKDEAFLDIVVGVRQTINKVIKKREETKRHDEIKMRYISNANAYIASGKYQEAYTVYREAVALFTDDASIHKNMGNLLFTLRRFAEAIKAYDDAIRLNHTSIQLYRDKANALIHLGRLEDATITYQYAIELVEDDFSLYQDLGNIFSTMGRFKEAANSFEKAIDLSPGNVALYISKGDALSMLTSYQDAPDIHASITNILEDALDAYEKAIRLSPENASVYAKKGHILAKLQRYPEAIEAHQESINFSSENTQFRRNKAETLKEAGHLYDAQQAYLEAINCDPNNPFLYKELGDILIELDDQPQALAAYNDAIQLDQNFGFAYLSRSKLHEYMAQQAYKTYERLSHFAQTDRERARQLNALEEDV